MSATLRRLARVAAAVVLAALAIPVVLLPVAATVDRGPDGSGRGSLFHVAMAALDPFVWTCAINSLVVAGLVTVGSLAIGVGLARIVGTWRFWGRPVLATLAWLPLAAPPAYAAVGLVGLVAPVGLGRTLAGLTDRPFLVGLGWDDAIGWALLVWANLAWSVPIVALSVEATLRRVDPAWADAGRGLGASGRRAWRDLVGPIVRPEVARTLAAVFATALFEPGSAIVLRVRRTLAFQVVEATARGDEPSRAAALALLGLGLALGGRALIRWWGGMRVDLDPDEREDRIPTASWLRAGLFSVGLVVWAGVGLTPLAGIGAILVGVGPVGGGPGRGAIEGLTSVAYRMLDPDTGRLWMNSLGLGLMSTGLAWAVVRLGEPERSSRRVAGRPSWLVLGLERVPPMVVGIGFLALPGLIRVGSSRVGGEAFSRLAAGLDPIRWPGLGLIAAVAIARLPTLTRAGDRAAWRARPALTDAALGLGASRRSAGRLGGGSGPGLGVLVLTFCLAATGVAPAIVLAPTTRTRPIGPGLVGLAEDRPRAAGLALGAVVLNLIGLVAARRGRAGRAGDWFRG